MLLLCSISVLGMRRVSPSIATLLAQSSMIVDQPASKQELLNSVLEDNGSRKPRPIPTALDHPPRFAVSYGRVLDLTEHTAIRSVLQDETVFYDKHRLTITEFLLLLALLEPAIGLTRHTNAVATHECAHAHTKLNAAEQLLLWLYWTKGTPLPALTDLFGLLHPTTLTRCIDHVTSCINTTLADVIHWPTADERRDVYGSIAVCDTAIGYLDGTHLPISRPTHSPAPYWSAYKSKPLGREASCDARTEASTAVRDGLARCRLGSSVWKGRGKCIVATK